MTFSYLGLSEPAEFINEILQKHIVLSRKEFDALPEPLVGGGVYTNNFAISTKFAADNNMGVYMTPEDMIEFSDVIFVFMSNRGLKSFASSLRGHGISNKIIVHFSPAFDSDILDFGFENTYISVYVPFLKGEFSDHDANSLFFVEGKGDRFQDFIYILKMMNITPAIITKDQRIMLITALSFRQELSNVINSVTKSLVDKSLENSPQISRLVNSALTDEQILLSSYNPIVDNNMIFIQNQTEVLNYYSISGSQKLLGLLYEFSNNDKPKDKNSNYISDISKKLINK